MLLAMSPRLRRLLTVLLVFAPGPAFGWGATGHEFASGVGAEILPDEIPAFVRQPDVVAEIAVLGRELDRSKGSGDPHDKERDAGHFVSLDDARRAGGVLALDRLPPTREAYDTILRTRNLTQYSAGCLPYSIVDGWQQIRMGFACRRAIVKRAATAATPGIAGLIRG